MLGDILSSFLPWFGVPVDTGLTSFKHLVVEERKAGRVDFVLSVYFINCIEFLFPSLFIML